MTNSIKRMKKNTKRNAISQELQDLTDDRYRDLRRPRIVVFYKNGDRYFKGKTLHITPHRYLHYDELLADLSKSMSLPYGVRRIYSPVESIEELKDGGSYVCASFEKFQRIKYGLYSDQSALRNRLPQSDYDHSYHGYPHTSTAAARLALHSTFPPPGGAAGNNNYYSKKTYNRPMTLGMVSPSHNPSTQRSNHLSASSYPAVATGGDYSPNHSDSLPMKPKVVTVVRAGTCRPHKKITILLNRRAVQTYEQLVADISEALGQPKWKNDHIRKLFTLKGREVKSVSDFFREDDCFIAVGREQLTTADIQDVLRELYPDSPYTESLIQRNLERNFRQQQQRQQANRRRGPPMKGSKSDSGLGDSTEGERIRPLNMKTRASHILNERRRFQEEERLKAKKWEKERWLREQQELNKDVSRRRCISQDSVGGLISPPSSQLPSDTRFILENTTRGRGKKKHPPVVSTSSPLRHHLNAWDDPSEELERKKEEEEERRRRRRMQEEDERRRRLDEEEAKERDRLRREREAIEREKMKILEEERMRKEREEAEKSRKLREEAERRRKREEDEKAKKRMLEEERKKKLQEAEDRRRREEELEREKKKVEEERRKLEEEKKRIREEEEKRVKEMQELEEKAKKAEEKQKEAEMNAAKEELKLLNKSDDNDRLKRLQKLKAPPRRVTSRNTIEARYEIGKIIGDGNFAVVRESRLRNTESEYAMKIIDKSKLKGKEDMIENEIAIMKNCHHPNIVRLIEEFETSSEIYLVLEYVKGGDLFDAITESVKFTERDAANMVADLCEALGFLHSKNIIHRDLKPENLLVSRNKDGSMTLKLADFGLAMEVTEPIYTVCGTPTYVAPEILAETGYGLEVDMWAAGVITYILLCGFPPFRSVERDQEELFEVIQLGDYEFLSPYWDSISDAAKDLIQRLLVVDTKRRYTAEQVLAHPWIQSEGIYKGPNLQREITMNLEKNFGERRRRAPRVHPVQ